MPPKRRLPPSQTPAPKPRQTKLQKEHNISASTELEIREAFTLFSTSSPSEKHGLLPTASIQRALTALGCPAASGADLQELLDVLDPEDEGLVAYEAFVGVAALQLANRSEESVREEVGRAFRLFVGQEGGERITVRTLKRVARELKEDVADQVLRDMIVEANGGGQGVGIREFEGVMRRAGVFS